MSRHTGAPGHYRDAPGEGVLLGVAQVDLETFARELVPPVMDLSRQTIVYASRNDAALGFSTLITRASRLGRPDVNDLGVDDLVRLGSDPRLQVVDVSDVRGAHEMGGMRGHGHWYANDWISTDVALSLRYPIPPDMRCLVPAGPKNVWKFPPDCVDCVAGRMIAAYPEVRRKSPLP